MTTFDISFQNIVKQVKSWPPDYRLALAQEILRTLGPNLSHHAFQSQTLEQALGLLTTEESPPTDAAISQWLRESRKERNE